MTTKKAKVFVVCRFCGSPVVGEEKLCERKPECAEAGLFRFYVLFALALLFASACTATVEEVTQGPAGERGEQGAQGERGPRGLPGAPAAPIERVRVQMHSELGEARGDILQATAECPEGSRIVTGGCMWAQDIEDVGSTYPYLARPLGGEEADESEGWTCIATDLLGESRIHAWAVCEVVP